MGLNGELNQSAPWKNELHRPTPPHSPEGEAMGHEGETDPCVPPDDHVPDLGGEGEGGIRGEPEYRTCTAPGRAGARGELSMVGESIY
jgi:hypothetical protein